jgi:uncharacterized protein
MSDAGTDAGAKTMTPVRLEPPASDAGQPFWDATREGRLELPWCTACDRPIWYPRAFCPACAGSDVDWRPASGRATVHAFTIEQAGQTRALEPPYVVALVDLDEGVRIMTNIVGVPADEVAVGARVEVVWEALSDGRQLPLFKPM